VISFFELISFTPAIGIDLPQATDQLIV